MNFCKIAGVLGFEWVALGQVRARQVITLRLSQLGPKTSPGESIWLPIMLSSYAVPWCCLSPVGHKPWDADRIVLEGEVVLKLNLDSIHHDHGDAAPDQGHLYQQIAGRSV